MRRLGSSTMDTARELPEHLVNLFQSGSDGLKPDEAETLRKVLMEYSEAFSKGDHDIGHFSAIQHHIHTGEAAPIKQRMRRTPLGYASEALCSSPGAMITSFDSPA